MQIGRDIAIDLDPEHDASYISIIVHERGGERSSVPATAFFFEPGENHWHGAAPNRFMAHVAMQQQDDAGSTVTWGEHVSDEQYQAAPSGA